MYKWNVREGWELGTGAGVEGWELVYRCMVIYKLLELKCDLPGQMQGVRFYFANQRCVVERYIHSFVPAECLEV